MKIERISLIIFAVVLIGLGILGLIKGDFPPGWTPVPQSLPAHRLIAYLGDIVCIACGAGLLWRRTSAIAGCMLFVWLLLWLLVLRMPWMVTDFGVGTWWAASSTSILTAAAWVLYISLVPDRDRQRFAFLTGNTGSLIARILFGLGLIPLGLAHFLYVDATAPLVPAWLLWPVFWAYFTGAAFIAAGIAIIFNIYARLAAALVTLQIALLTLIVWAPRVVTGNLTAFQWNEFVVSILLTAAAWVVTDSYRGTSWLAMREPKS